MRNHKAISKWKVWMSLFSNRSHFFRRPLYIPEVPGRIEIKKIMLLAVLVLAIFCCNEIFANSVDYLSSQSAEYVRTLSRNASTDADCVHYNPAGTMFMPDGVYLYLSNQTVLMDYTNTMQIAGAGSLNKDYQSSSAAYFVPNLYFIYKKTSWSLQMGAGVLAGGGAVNFKEGVPFMAALGLSMPGMANGPWIFQSGNLKVLPIYPYFSLGVSYAVNDWLSVSLTGRYIYAYKKYDGAATWIDQTSVLHSASLDAKETATGVGGILGMDIKPSSNSLIAVRFETVTSLDFKTQVNHNQDFDLGSEGIFKDGYTRKKDLPAMLAVGASYSPVQNFTLTGSLNLFFIGYTGENYDDQVSNDIYAKSGYNKEFDKVGWEASISLEYAIIPKFLSASIGYNHEKVGGNSKTYNDFDYSLDSDSIGLGIKLMLQESLDLTLACAKIMYKTSDGYYNQAADAYFVKYKKSFWIIGIGLQYRL